MRLLYLHGGGLVSGSGGFYLPLAAHISAAAKCAVLLPDYRLAPEHPFPAGLEDCVRAHEWMIANGPSGPGPAKATFIAGDSAGGNLTLATLLALRDRKLPLPAGGIPLSAATDFTLASESLKTVNDPIISARTMPEFRDRYLGKTDPRNPLASPVFGDYRGIPPLLIQVGEHEMLRDDSVRVAKKARADGIPVKLEVWPGMFHVFQSHEPLLPEAQQAIEHIADFMRSAHDSTISYRQRFEHDPGRSAHELTCRPQRMGRREQGEQRGSQHGAGQRMAGGSAGGICASESRWPADDRTVRSGHGTIAMSTAMCGARFGSGPPCRATCIAASVNCARAFR